MFALHDKLVNDFFGFSKDDVSSSDFSLIPRQSLFDFPSDRFFDNLWSVPDTFKTLGSGSDVRYQEEKDQYLVSFDEKHIQDKNFDINFAKDRNELTIKIEDKNGENYSNYVNSYVFDKAVNPNEINASVNDGKVLISIPKVAKDAENIVNIKINGIERPMIDSKEHGLREEGK
ncbi:small heat shock protein 21 [[Candida] jaroonii]|uniref:Small heat shock protein 21 n=1 Tax=[Candida] jaroonii TaxID=467808 RepID=A0ACA9YE59_9ASCO|nr:small heat shock protein 21 [[Candida] jaroonii]